MNAHTSPEEQRILAEAGETPSLLDEKKFLEERRRRLEASLQEHMVELKDRGEQAGKVALIGAGALVGVWLVAKAIGSIAGSRKHKKSRALKSHVKMSALGPGAAQARDNAPAPGNRPASNAPASGNRPTGGPTGGGAPFRPTPEFDSPAPRPRSYADEEGEARRPRPTPPPPAPEPAGPSMFQTFMESEAGRMMTNQLVALLMVFVTRKLESVLQIERSTDIGSVKESDLTPYRIVDPVSDATVVPDDAESARPNAPVAPTATT